MIINIFHYHYHYHYDEVIGDSDLDDDLTNIHKHLYSYLVIRYSDQTEVSAGKN